MAKKQYELEVVRRSLVNKGVRVSSVETGSIADISGAHDLGNGSWGKLDYLTNHCGYMIQGRQEYLKNT